MIHIKENCFAHTVSKCGRVSCSALTDMQCDGCNFYKTVEQQQKDLEEAVLSRQRRGIQLR